MATYPPTDKTTITRLAKRGSYDKETIYSILDEALLCTIAFVQNNEPFQIPTGFCRIGDKLYVHGSVGSSYIRSLAENNLPVCISVTLLDGLVLARSAFHHSMNYRSVVLFSKAEKVTDSQEIYRALEVFTNKVQPGRWNDIRQPNAGEWKATLILSFSIEEVSAKVRTGGPKDDEEDYALDIWAGVVPLTLERKDPVPDEVLKADIALPDYLSRDPKLPQSSPNQELTRGWNRSHSLPERIKEMRIEHIAIWTFDLERLRQFYEKYFGAVAGEKYLNPKKNFQSYFLTFSNGCRLELMTSPDIAESVKGDNQRTGFIHIAISVGDKTIVDQLTERLKSDGYQVAGAPRTTGDGYYESVILDPDGNRIEITV